MFTKILVPFDGSPHSQRALQTAAELAQLTRSAVHVIYAYEHLPVYLGEPNFPDLLNRVLNEARDILDGAVGQLKNAGIPVTGDVLEGPPAQAILAVTEAEKFDLIVMGSRGLGQLEGLLLGSVSDRVLHHARVPVLITR
jgi:nucleotide-binding universal stress UspA family protein